MMLQGKENDAITLNGEDSEKGWGKSDCIT